MVLYFIIKDEGGDQLVDSSHRSMTTFYELLHIKLLIIARFLVHFSADDFVLSVVFAFFV